MKPPLCSQVVPPFTLFACILGTIFNFASARFISTNDINATIAATPQSAVKQVGTNVAFNCSVTGHLPPSAIIQWDKNTLPKGCITRMLDDRTSQLILNNVQLEDAQPGYYTCCLVLQDGRCSGIEAHVRLKVGFLPAPVRNLTCFSHDIHVGFCTWNNPERDSILQTTYTLQRRLFTKKSELDWYTVGPCYNYSHDTVADNMCAWHDEEPDKRFSYRVVSKNSLGEVATVMTKPPDFNVHHDAVPYPPHSITVKALSSESIRVIWETPHSFYPFQIKNKIRYNTTFYSWIEEVLHGPDEKFEKNDFHPPYALICVQLASRQNLYGEDEERAKWSKWSESQCAHLGEEKPATEPDIITHVVKENENDRRNLKDVDLSWMPLPEDKRNGKILGYNISVIGYLKSFTTENREYSVSENVTQLLIPDLNRTLDYIFFISAFNSKGSSPAANVTIKANPFTPDPIQDTLAAYVVPVAVLLLLILCFTTYCSWKKITKKTFEVRMPDIVMQSNTYNNVVSTAFRTQEPEYFDEVKVIRSQLYVNMDIVDERSEVTVYQNCLGPKGYSYSLENIPLLDSGIRNEASEQMDTLQSAATRLLSGASNSEQYSPRSVGSGGSYWSTKDDNDIIYKRMTPQGLSPLDKCSPGNQWDQEDKDQPVDNGADNDSCGGGSAIDVYVKQSSIPGMPGMNNHSRSSSQNLSQHLAVPTPSGISAASRASSQESDIDNYVKQGQLEATLSKQSCEKAMEKKKAGLDQGQIGGEKRDGISKNTSSNSGSRSTSEIHLSPMANYVRSGNLCIGGSANSLQSEQLSNTSENQLGPVANYVRTGTQSGDLDIDCLSSQNNEQSQSLHETSSNPVSNYVQSLFSNSDNSTDSSQSDDEQSQTSTESHSSSVAHYVKSSAAYPEDLHVESSTCSSQNVEQLQSPDANFVAHKNTSRDYISGRDLPSSGSPQVPQIIENGACCSGNSNTLGDSDNSSRINHEEPYIQLGSYLPEQFDEPEHHHTSVTDDLSSQVFPQTSGASYDGFAVTVSQTSPGGSSTDLNSSQTNSEASALESGYGSLTKSGTINDSGHTEPENTVLTMPEISTSDDNLFVLPHIAEDFSSSSNPTSNFDISPQSEGYVPHNAVLGRSGKPPALQSVSPPNSDVNSGYVAHDRLRPSGTVQPNLVPNSSRSRRESDDGYSSSYGNGTPPDTPNVHNEIDLPQNHNLEEDVSQIEMNDLSVQPSQGTHSGYVAHSAV